MLIRSLDKTLQGRNATVEFEQGDHLSVGFELADGTWGVISISMSGHELKVVHEQGGDMVVVPR